MTISKDLFISILAMDAYHQSYNSGFEHGKTKVGSATIDTDSEREFREEGADQNTPTPAQNAGFYAIAYDVDGSQIDGWTGEDTVISYCGVEQVCIWKAAA